MTVEEALRAVQGSLDAYDRDDWFSIALVLAAEVFNLREELRK
jgi:hypothetical protein